jgi:predicted  nucleic acid-binding Zn-ribbon protein
LSFTGETEKLKATKLEMRKEVVTIESEVANLRAELKRVDTELRVYQTKKTQLESQLEASRERESRLSGTVAESSRLKLDNEALVCSCCLMFI